MVALSLKNEKALKGLLKSDAQHIHRENGLKNGGVGPFFRWINFYFISPEDTKAVPTISLANWSRLCIAASKFCDNERDSLDDKTVDSLYTYAGEAIPIEVTTRQKQSLIKDLIKDLFACSALVRPGDLSQLVPQPTTNTAGAANGIEEEQQSTEAVDDTEIHHQLDRLPVHTIILESIVCSISSSTGEHRDFKSSSVSSRVVAAATCRGTTTVWPSLHSL